MRAFDYSEIALFQVDQYEQLLKPEAADVEEEIEDNEHFEQEMAEMAEMRIK